MKKKRTLMIFLFLFLLFSSVSFADWRTDVKHVGEEWKERNDGMNIFSKTKLWFQQNVMRAFTTIGGYLCSTHPDETGSYEEDGASYTCPSDLRGGCALVIYNDGDPNDFYEKEMAPGDYTGLISDGDTYEVYYCNEDCTCTDYESEGCGDGPCDDDEMYKTRDCDEHEEDGEMVPCATEEVCVEGHEECEEDECTDTDGGKDYYNKGTATDDYQSKTDTCGSNNEWLTEYYCDDGIVDWESKKCDYGCEDGECFSEPQCEGTRDSCCDDNDCTDYCSDDRLLNKNGYCGTEGEECNYDSYDCSNDDGYYGDEFCKNDDVYREWRTYSCSNAQCEYTAEDSNVETCGTNEKCENGECVEEGEHEGVIDIVFKGVLSIFK
ncbi:MAG: hypothetical protein ACOCQD_01875 [archaeon]